MGFPKSDTPPFSIKKREATGGKTATEEYFQSIYLNPTAKNYEDVIIFHRPFFESLATGIICLKSLRLEKCIGMVLQAPKSILKEFGNKILEQDKQNKISKRPLGEIFEKLKNEALTSGVSIVYEQRPDLDESPIKNTTEDGQQRQSNPKKMQQKIANAVSIVNAKMEKLEIIAWPTVEYADDVPILRILSGLKNPYTAERLGSFAFFSNERGMKWYKKQFKESDFKPDASRVYLTYFCDVAKKETVEGALHIEDTAEKWAEHILTCLKSIIKKVAQSQLMSLMSALRTADVRKSEVQIKSSENFTEVTIAVPHHKTVCLKYLLGDQIKEASPGVVVAKIINS